MDSSFDVYIWRRCGYRVLLSARAHPSSGLRQLVAHLDLMADRSWAELIGCHNVGQQYAGDWLEDRGLPRPYARQIICIEGPHGPYVEVVAPQHLTMLRDNSGAEVRVHKAWPEDWLTESDPAVGKDPARDRHAP